MTENSEIVSQSPLVPGVEPQVTPPLRQQTRSDGRSEAEQLAPWCAQHNLKLNKLKTVEMTLEPHSAASSPPSTQDEPPTPAQVLPAELSDELYQKIAAEMNLSETAFITRLSPSDDFSKGSRFRLRWFTPSTEVNLCGHATLASAAVLFQCLKNVNAMLAFETRSGDLFVTRQGDGFVMDFPLNPPTQEDPNEFRDIIKAVVGDLPVQDVYLSANTKKLLLQLADSCNRSALTSLKVDPVLLQNSERSGRVRGVIVTMKGSPDCQPGYDFYSRYFAPWAGIPEDPVTGSAHTVSGCYWSKKLGKKKMMAYQCSSRGGELELLVRDDGRINIAGQAVTVLQGTIRL